MARAPPVPGPRRTGVSSSRSSSPSPGGTASARVGASAPPSGSGSRSRTSSASCAAATVAASDSARRRRAPRRTRRGASRAISSVRGAGARAASSRNAASHARSSAGSRPGRGGPHQRQRRHERQHGRAHQPAAGRDHDHRGASIFSMIPRSAASAVMPSSSSSGATAIRCRSTAVRELLHVVGHDVRPPVEQRRGLRHLEQGHAAARRRAQREHRRRARGAHDGRDVGHQARLDPHPAHGVAQLGQARAVRHALDAVARREVRLEAAQHALEDPLLHPLLRDTR